MISLTWLGDSPSASCCIRADGHTSILSTGFGRGRLVAVAAAPCGDVYAAERGGGGRVVRFGRDGKAEWTISIPGAQFYGLTVDGGFLYALDLGHRQLLRIPLTGCSPAAIKAATTQAAQRQN